MIRLTDLAGKSSFNIGGKKFEYGKVYSNPYATAFKPVNEAEGSKDHEVSMAQNQLDSIIKSATELKQKMGEEEKQIPAWIQDHITNSENYISQAASNYHEYGDSNEVNEAFNIKLLPTWLFDDVKDFEYWYKHGMALGSSRGKIASLNNSDEKKLFDLIKKWRNNDSTAQDNIKQLFKQKAKVVKNESINEDSETKRLEMLIKNLEETNKLLVQQIKDNKSLSSNKKENIKKSIALNLDLINYYKKWLKDYQSAANESLVNEAGPCWKGYKQVGMKNKNGREVPNCVPESVMNEASVAKLHKDLAKVVDAIENELTKYKSNKGTDKAKQNVENLKKLNITKKKIEAEMDKTISSLYKDAELEEGCGCK
jgi:hypothetical protein